MKAIARIDCGSGGCPTVYELGEVAAGTHCGSGTCPTVVQSRLSDDDLLVQGYEVIDVETPEGERVVRVPKSLVLEAAAACS